MTDDMDGRADDSQVDDNFGAMYVKVAWRLSRARGIALHDPVSRWGQATARRAASNAAQNDGGRPARNSRRGLPQKSCFAKINRLSP